MLDATVITGVATPQHDSADSLATSRMPCGRIWTVVQSHPGAERWARDNLARAGYPVYLPLCLTTRRDPVLRTLTRQVEVPLFAGYLFLEMGEAEPWTPIRYTQGVLRLLMTDGKPGRVNAGVLSALQATEAVRRTTPTSHPATWPPGAVCAPAIGILAGHRGVVVRTSRSHVTLAVMLLGGLREVTLALDCVGPAT